MDNLLGIAVFILLGETREGAKKFQVALKASALRADGRTGER
jgi:hypothetical protein